MILRYLEDWEDVPMAEEKGEKKREEKKEGTREKIEGLRNAVKKLIETEEEKKREEERRRKKGEIEFTTEIEQLASWITHNIVEQIERIIELREEVEEEIKEKVEDIIEAEIARYLAEKGILETEKVPYTPVVYTCPMCGYTTTIYKGICPKCGAVLERIG